MGSSSSTASSSGSMYLMVTTLVILLGLSAVSQVKAAAIAQFIFGDSLVDQGNNNNINTLAKANFPPHGIDLAMSNHQPTGRFSNGRIISDFISEYMGTEPVVAYNDADANGANLLRGVNFASAGSGVLDDTGNIFIGHFSMTQQFSFFQNVQAEIISMVGTAAANQLFAKALWSFTIGGNDYVNNYLIPGSQRAQQYNIQQYTNLLIDGFQEQVKTLYNFGARKISIPNMGPIGCIPDQLSTKSLAGDCVDSVNQMALSFNALLHPMLLSLGQQLPGITIVYSDSYSFVYDFINNAASYGFTTTNVACCGTGRFNGNIPCTALATVCPDRSVYLFWDPFHPTDKANSYVTQRLLYGPTTDISPINLSQLIDL